MKRMKIMMAILSTVLLGSPLFAADVILIPTQENPPLHIAISNFGPPFVMRGANDQFFGFDVALMEYICTTIHRPCQYHPLLFSQLLGAVETKKTDVALGAITITAERATQVNFSVPYLPSESRFIGLTPLSTQPFSLQMLANKKIGITEATIFKKQVELLGLKNSEIIEYRRVEAVIDALNAGEVDLALMDNPSALYWQSTSTGTLSVLGSPMAFGFGFGVAVNRDNTSLLQQINQAILQYQKGPQFKADYDKYLGQF